MRFYETLKIAAFGVVCGFALGLITYCWVHIICQTSQTCQTLLVRRPRIIMGNAFSFPTNDLLFK